LIVGEYPEVDTPPWLDEDLLASGFALSRQGLWLESAAVALMGSRSEDLVATADGAAEAALDASLE
jgi:hypothetical protein